MRKRVLLIIAAMLVAICGSLVIKELIIREPSYEGRKASYWVKQLNSRDNALRENAFEAMHELGPAAIPYLTKAPRPEDTRLKAIGEKLHRALAPYAPKRVRRKLPFRPGGSIVVGSGAATALGAMGPKARSAIPTLLKWLDDPDENISNSAFIALLRIGADDEQIVSVLLKKLKRTSGFMLTMLLTNPAGYYDEIDPHAVAAIPLLTFALRSNDPYARMYAAIALGKFGNAATELKPELESALSSTNLEDRVGAAIGLWRLDGRLEPTLKILNEGLQSRLVHKPAILGVTEIGPPAKDSVPLLVPFLQDTRPLFSAWASNAIQRIDPVNAAKILNQPLDDW